MCCIELIKLYFSKIMYYDEYHGTYKFYHKKNTNIFKKKNILYI